MIFHKKFFQCVMAPRPLFLTPQKTCLLRSFIIAGKGFTDWEVVREDQGGHGMAPQ